MRPTGSGPQTSMRHRDTIEVPVHLRYSTPLSPRRRARPASFDAAVNPWPIGSIPTADGFYLVSTTWRAVLDAAITTGRNHRDWLTAYPGLARLEILTRTTPLRAYLGLLNVAGAPHVVANDVYLNGTERTAQAAAGYRVGMTLAEFTAKALLGLGPTRHAESITPVGAGPNWSNAKRQPDLVAYRGGLPWLIEAKGGRKLGLATLRKGATQLTASGLMAGPHARVLCGTSLTHRLLMTVDIELPDLWERRRLDYLEDVAAFTTSIESRSARDAAPDLARTRMLIYHAISSASPSQRFVRQFRDEPNAIREPSSWAVTPAEDGRVAAAQDFGRFGAAAPDVIAVRIPGTGISVGLSAQLYAACRLNADFDRIAAEVADRSGVRVLTNDGEEGGPVPGFANRDTQPTDPSSVDSRVADRINRYNRAYGRLQGRADEEISSTFDRYESATASDAIGHHDSEILTQSPESALEGLSRGTYIAVDVDTVPEPLG